MEEDDERMLGGVLDDSHLAVFEDLPALVARHAEKAGLELPLIYVTDLQQRMLVPLAGQRDSFGRPLKPMRIDGSVPGRAYRGLEIVRSNRAFGVHPWRPDPQRLWLPLLDGTERLGVLGVIIDADTPSVRERARRLAGLIALILVGKRDFSDTYAELSRTAPMSLSAELTRGLMPMSTFATEDIVVGAVTEPAYAAGGDAYDYALSGSVLHVAIFDSMGHDTAAGLTSTIAMAACRNARRRGAAPAAVADMIDEAIAEQFAEPRFATGVVADIDVRSGIVTWINRAHPPPLVIRRNRYVTDLDSPPCTPMGFRMERSPAPSRYQLEPGDRVVLYTDGVVDAVNDQRERFGLERFVDFIIRREIDGLSAPETLRRLVHTVLEHQGDRLDDDATVLLVEWRAGPKRLLL
ncbi:PP2C family protein-serine/threonine phosphatase [Thermomonospora cellulosilytica]|uniref:Serine phosphatase RsbU (Regulator of sigma subunit) n=1 Tax=Thermomonospora cellulosilytica TaxID=1411118 RepID=A0A7W3MSZ3_9ACTN|nr:PP2C family protein-serine/threonine phosphatase [Thermomonospora cellulosilytica]MBA9001340.1 serine phosphatase RsbU (regulator of sigma subunit) [Thermomonospora cellulosilytica]